MKYSQKDLAILFSNGKFADTKDYLSECIVWNVIGEGIFEGKNAVIQKCEATAEYFKSVETDFRTNDVLVSENKVVVLGTAEFKRGGERITFVSACDVYEFSEKSELLKISSYCISEKMQ